jgi:branched-chain amino acid transport system ATP-binding protein
MTTALSLHEITKSFGGLKAVDGVSFDLPPAVVTALIGPNGAGKTTIINLIAGILAPNGGKVTLGETDITASPIYRRACLGVARTYQTPQMIHGLSALENVMAGAYRFGTHGLLTTIVMPWVVARENSAMADRAAAALRKAAIPEIWWDRRAVDLPYGIQRRIEIARAIAQDPKVLMLDEPAAGLNPAETEEVGELLTEIAADGVSVLLVEHDMPLVMSTATQVIVVNFGRRLAVGTPAQIMANPDVVAAYLGTDEDADQEVFA